MARKRFRAPGYVASTRGHSSIKKWTYSPRYLDDTYVPEFVYPRHRIDTSGEENDIRRSVNKELMFSSHAVDDTYDMASKSRNRDQEILRNATQAIVDTETYHSPKASVASRRARSQPPSSVTVTARSTLSSRSSVPPRATVVSVPSYTSKRGSRKEVVYVVSPKRSSISSTPASIKSADKSIRVDKSKVAMAGGSSLPLTAMPIYRILPHRKYFVNSPTGVESRSMVVRTLGKTLVLPLYSRAYYPKTQTTEPYFNTPVAPKGVAAVRVYAPPVAYKRLRKAALVGSKVDVVVPKRKRPRSKYAQAVVRELNLKRHDEAQGSEIPQSSTGHLHASSRPVRSSGDGKPYWDEEGKLTKPKNILSWKYKLQSRVAPDDLLYQPKVYANVRDQLREVHDKMDRHRQLMDRYLITDPSTEDGTYRRRY